jgi:hypothetical protein
MPNTTKVFIARAEVRGAPESIIAGLYPTKAQAERRCRQMEEEGYDLTWYDIANVTAQGADLNLYNR